MAKATQVHTKHPSEVRNCSVSFANLLDTSELLTGTPTVTATPSGLTFGSQQVNASQLTVSGVAIPIGKAVQFRVSGGSSGVEYRLEVSCGTNASPAQTLVVECSLLVLDT